jgi:hypothetical protein
VGINLPRSVFLLKAIKNSSLNLQRLYFSTLFVLVFLLFFVLFFFFLVLFAVGLRAISSSMGNEYQQEDLYDFRFDVAADQSVDRDSDCPEFDFPGGGGGGGELGAVEELARLAEEEAAAAASAQQPGRGSPPASMSKITSAGT